MTTDEYLIARKSRNWNFNSVVDKNSFSNVTKIHPLKQRLVKEIVDAAKKDGFVRRLIVYGSSTRYDCDITSDLDICIDWKENCYDSDGVLKPFTNNMRKAISLITKGRADVINYESLGDSVVEDAVMKGVVVYE